jgi:hypothetical protein
MGELELGEGAKEESEEDDDEDLGPADWEDLLGSGPSVRQRTAAAASGGKWTKTEDQALKAIVDQHGAKNWRQLSELLGTSRTDVQCLHRWNKVLALLVGGLARARAPPQPRFSVWSARS